MVNYGQQKEATTFDDDTMFFDTLQSSGAVWVAGASTLGYYILRLVLRDRLGRYTWYQALQGKADRTNLFELYILSIVNATGISAYSLWKIFGTGTSNTVGATRLLATALGYFLHDFIAMRREFSNDWSMFFHHVFGIAVISNVNRSCAIVSNLSCLTCCFTQVMVAPKETKRYIPMFGVIELSTVFMSLMWLLRETGNNKGRFFKANLIMFATTFFGTRILLMPAKLKEAWTEKDFQALGVAKYMMAGLCGLNVYWFIKLVRMARGQLAR